MGTDHGLSVWDRRLSKLENAIALLAGGCVALMMILGIAQVLGRQVLDLPVPGYIDLVELGMSTVAFLAVAYCQRLGGHVRMELVLAHLPLRLRFILEAVGTALALGLVLVLTVYGYDHAMRAFDLGDSSIDADLPVWPSKLLVPFAFSLLSLRLTLQLAGFLRLVLNPALEPVAVPVVESVEEEARQEIEDALGQDGSKPLEGERSHGTA